jgi:hypothetical protein
MVRCVFFVQRCQRVDVSAIEGFDPEPNNVFGCMTLPGSDGLP